LRRSCSLSSQTIAAGTILTGKDGVQVITDQAAIIPAGNPPIYGQVTVSAHAVIAGTEGNIPAYDINAGCCGNSVLAKNTRAFTGGASARDFLVVTRGDIQDAAMSLQASIAQGEHAALQIQLQPGEELITPPCTSRVSSDHKPGDEAKQVSVTISDTCSGIAYDAHTLHQNATQLITSQAITKLGANYALIGDIQISIVRARVMNPRRGLVSIVVQNAGTWVYQITPDIKQHFIHLIAGKPKQQAIATLLKFPGIQGAQITLRGGNQTLPEDPRDIKISVLYRTV